MPPKLSSQRRPHRPLPPQAHPQPLPRHPPLRWVMRTSIVDLLKLLGLDSSMSARKELATELMYSGSEEPGSAAWNIWLHKQVMRSIAANGGTLPPERRD